MKKKLKTIKWDKSDQVAAIEQGWGIFKSDDGIVIQRIDEDEIFASDEAAIRFVLEQAETSALHKKAVMVIKKANPTEYWLNTGGRGHKAIESVWPVKNLKITVK